MSSLPAVGATSIRGMPAASMLSMTASMPAPPCTSVSDKYFSTPTQPGLLRCSTMA